MIDSVLSAALINAPRSSPSFARTVIVGPVFHALKYDSGLILGVGAGVARSTGVAVGEGDGLGLGLGLGVGVAVAVGVGDGVGHRLSLRFRFPPHLKASAETAIRATKEMRRSALTTGKLTPSQLLNNARFCGLCAFLSSQAVTHETQPACSR